MKFKKLVSYIISGAIVLSVSSFSSSAATFSDVSGHWAENAINRWSTTYGIVQGSDGKFHPNDNITRAEMATILNRIVCYTKTSSAEFSDVKSGDWYRDAILKLNAADVMGGDGVSMRPNDNITRQEAAVLVAKAFSIDESSTAVHYVDKSSIASWALGYVAAMSENGYMSGSGGYFTPNSLLTRAQAVTIFDEMISQLYSSKSTVTADVDGMVVVNSASGMNFKNMKINGSLIICPNVTRGMALENVTVNGNIINMSGVDISDTVTSSSQQQYITFGSHQIPVVSGVPVNSYDKTKFSTSNGVTTYPDTYSGIDVSSHQGIIDWSQVKTSGIDFAMLRVGYRGYGSAGTLVVDSTFAANAATCENLDIPMGVYFFSQAITEQEAIEEAEFAISYIKKYNITYPVVYDWETISGATARTDNLDNAILNKCAVAFCKTIADAGYTPLVYFNTNLGLMKYDVSAICDYDFWFAGYSSTPNFYYDFKMWQYSDSGSVPGINTKVDLDISFVDFSK